MTRTVGITVFASRTFFLIYFFHRLDCSATLLAKRRVSKLYSFLCQTKVRCRPAGCPALARAPPMAVARPTVVCASEMTSVYGRELQTIGCDSNISSRYWSGAHFRLATIDSRNNFPPCFKQFIIYLLLYFSTGFSFAKRNISYVHTIECYRLSR